MSESKLAQLIQYPGNGLGIGAAQCYETVKQMSAEDIEKMRAENEKREEQYRQRAVVAATVELAEKLLIAGHTPETALATAQSFTVGVKEFAKELGL